MTSSPGRGSVERIAADANVILSAIAGKAALKVFARGSVRVVTTATNLAEVEEYLPEMARLYGLLPEVLTTQLRMLDIAVCDRSHYVSCLEEATRRIGDRDPDDLDLLALALEIPVWSNDSDFEDSGVEWYTTAELLRRLGTG